MEIKAAIKFLIRVLYGPLKDNAKDKCDTSKRQRALRNSPRYAYLLLEMVLQAYVCSAMAWIQKPPTYLQQHQQHVKNKNITNIC